MNNFTRKFLIFVTIFISVFTVYSCTSTSEDTTTAAASSTSVQTTDATTISTVTSVQTTDGTTTVATTTFVDMSRLVIRGTFDTIYDVNDTIDLSGIYVIFYDSEDRQHILTDTDYTITYPDMSTSGDKQIIITYGDYQLALDIEVLEVVIEDYYLSAYGLSGSELFLELRNIIHDGFQGVTYGDARYILDDTDADPDHPGNVILVYLGTSVSGVWDEGATWNREHVWPQNAMPVDASNPAINMASDLHNLKPSDPNENSSRGNDFFANTNDGDFYEPRDEVKGDVARILLYMVVMYDQLSLKDGTPNQNNYEMGLLSVLLQWNHDDPVDEFEMHRNDLIETYQHNRNPFIDHPEYADEIWN